MSMDRVDALTALGARLAVLLACCAILAAFALPSLADDTLRCSAGLVETGDPAAVVRQTCGAPDFVDPWIGGAGLAYGQALAMEAWTYNRGPNQLIQILTFRNGELERITSAGYGFNETPGRGNCAPSAIVPGLSKYGLVQMCGQPVQRSPGVFVYSRRRHLNGRDIYLRHGQVLAFRETWIYNFGANRLLREVTLENGIVVEVETTERGFDD